MITDSIKLQKPQVKDQIQLADKRVLVIHAIQYEKIKGKLTVVHVVIEWLLGAEEGNRDILPYKEWLSLIKKATLQKRDR